MQITELPTEGFERVASAVEPRCGLHAFIAVHDTTLGPGLGGLRMWPYETPQHALTDVLRLAQGMTYKSAVAHTGVGGAKAVIIGEPGTIKSEALYLAMGRFIDAFDGRYITAEDVNTTIEDLEIVRRATRFVTGLSVEMGGSGNPSPFTALGVFLGVEAAVRWKLGEASVAGLRVGVQGVGAVGSALVRRLVDAGAEVLVADRRRDRVDALVDELGVEPVGETEIFRRELDVLSPCALGAVFDDRTVPALRCAIVAGAANNVLAEPRHGAALERAGILYAPDYVINAGGIINVAAELDEAGYDREAALRRIQRIPEALEQVWTIARDQGIPASEAADRLARQILEQGDQR
jgi:leucine dehydrogenase